jgi:hypothetical protein
MVIDTQEQGIDNNRQHDNILKGLGLNNFKALKS